MPPRARSPSPTDDQPPCNRPKKHEFSPLFNNEDGKADLIIRSSDKISFAIQRAILVAHSSVFENILSIPQPPPAEGSPSSSKEELPVVDISEGKEEVELLLRYVYPSAYLVDGAAPELTGMDVLCALLNAAEKYDAFQVLDVVLEVQLSRALLQSPLTSWAVAARFGRLKQSKDALKILAQKNRGEPLSGSRTFVPSTRRWSEGRREYCLGDIDEDELKRVPTSSIINFSLVHAKVVASQDGSYTWLDAADEFKL